MTKCEKVKFDLCYDLHDGFGIFTISVVSVRAYV